VGTKSLSPGVRQLWHKAEVKNAQSYTSTPPYIFRSDVFFFMDFTERNCEDVNLIELAQDSGSSNEFSGSKTREVMNSKVCSMNLYYVQSDQF
jgi:hypothetical protein